MKFGQNCALYTAPRSSGYFVRKRLWSQKWKRLWSQSVSDKGRHRAARAAKKLNFWEEYTLLAECISGFFQYCVLTLFCVLQEAIDAVCKTPLQVVFLSSFL